MADIIITQAGLEALVNSQKTGTNALVLASVQFGSGQYTPTGNETALQSSFKTLTTISGGNAGDNVIHITANDISSDAYTVYEVGVFTSDGVLFAIASQTTPIIQKASSSQALLSLDFVVESAGDGDIVCGDTDFFNPPATTEMAGVVELATAAEAAAGTDSSRAITPAALAKAGNAFDANSIPGAKIVNGSVANSQLGANSVTAAKIATGAVETDKLKDLAVTSGKIASGAVTSDKLGANSVTNGKIAANAVVTTNVQDSAITTQKIANGNVSTEKLANDSVTSEKIADGSVTPEKFSTNLSIDDLPASWLDALMPAGEFILVAGTTLPTRTLLCNGAAVSRTTYSRLFAVIGTKYGAGDGSTTFNLPNLNGRVLQGVSDTSQVGTYKEASLPNIFGNISDTYTGDAEAGCDGALYFVYPNGKRVTVTELSSPGPAHFALDASKSNSTYAGSVLQVPACLCQIAIRF